MPCQSNIIGIDIGSVAIAVAQMDLKGDIIDTAYAFHQGQIVSSLRAVLNRLDIGQTCGIASTSSIPPIVKTTAQFDTRIAVIEAACRFYQNIGAILLAGAGKFGLIRFDEDGNYFKFKANTSCAAGTGSFLDQQAQRLNLGGIRKLAEIAYNNSGAMPKIASRCAVFVKTDLVHARAAYRLNPEVDTIIEIGGQDSKFTTLKNGSVTFAAMNAVCAAGTGGNKNDVIIPYLNYPRDTKSLNRLTMVSRFNETVSKIP